MKTILKITALSAILLMLAGGLVSCREKFNDSHCFIERPESLMPISWDNYNDVFTVFWTYSKLEDGFAHSTREIRRDTAKTIKLYGWLHQGDDSLVDITSLTLVGNKEHIFAPIETISQGIFNIPSLPKVTLRFVGEEGLIEVLKNKLDATDITRKCFIRGRLYFGGTTCVSFSNRTGCCWINNFFIRIYSADDIYFE